MKLAKKKRFVWTWDEGETNNQRCTSNGHPHIFIGTQPFVTTFMCFDYL